ncbi:hypothetical protein [Nocardia brasiliensis]|uniref:hypothetical protein n=1 Tax=Nocardia brasiliensis TaxID=37326 RepID=UPI0036710CDE
MSYPELPAQPQWRRTGNTYFPVAARVEGHWWVLRLNGFPDHPLWTLFVDGQRRFDLETAPSTWGPLHDAPMLETSTAQDILAPIRDFVAYASEIGDPCDNPFCCG